MQTKVSEGGILCISIAAVYIYTKWKPPGVAFTYTWLFKSLLAAIAESNTALALAFCVGFGLNFSWYVSQLVDSLLWYTLIPYWENYFPKWCQHSIIRCGDIMLHAVPLFFLLPYCRFITWKLCFYAFIFERFYFFITENKPFGTGSVINIIYDFRPHLPIRTFLLSQYLTNLCYVLLGLTTIKTTWIRVPLLALCLSIMLYICVNHFNRMCEKNKTEQDFFLESYTIRINDLSQDMQELILTYIEQGIQKKLEKTFECVDVIPRFSISEFWQNLPKGYDITDLGIKTSQGRLVLWDKFADVASQILKLHPNWWFLELSRNFHIWGFSLRDDSFILERLLHAIISSFDTNVSTLSPKALTATFNDKSPVEKKKTQSRKLSISKIKDFNRNTSQKHYPQNKPLVSPSSRCARNLNKLLENVETEFSRSPNSQSTLYRTASTISRSSSA